MGFVLEFDTKNNILRGALGGPVTDSLVLSSYEAAARFATSLPPCRGLWDFSQVTNFDLSSDAVSFLVRAPTNVRFVRGYFLGLRPLPNTAILRFEPT
jgi:hypothetical protein